MALAKAMEHTIDLNMTREIDDTTMSDQSTTLDAPTEWIGSVKPLLICLINLKSTISGTYAAEPALQKLMQQYGDILMDCWSHEEGEEILGASYHSRHCDRNDSAS